jgi:hypothetical protein
MIILLSCEAFGRLMIGAGKPTRQIAEELALSAETVSTYRARIFEKMRMRTPGELAAYVADDIMTLFPRQHDAPQG